MKLPTNAARGALFRVRAESWWESAASKLRAGSAPSGHRPICLADSLLAERERPLCVTSGAEQRCRTCQFFYGFSESRSPWSSSWCWSALF